MCPVYMDGRQNMHCKCYAGSAEEVVVVLADLSGQHFMSQHPATCKEGSTVAHMKRRHLV